MHIAAIMATVFVLIALGELPDKSMFATLVLAARGRPFAVWAGASSAFLVHVCFAVVAGGLLALLPRVVVDSIAAALFLAGAVYVLREGRTHDEAADAVDVVDSRAGHRAFVTTFLVIFVAEWGDITQLLVANFAARYDAPIAVGIAAVLALWAVSALAVLASRSIQRLPMTVVRRTSAAVMIALAAWSAVSAAAA